MNYRLLYCFPFFLSAALIFIAALFTFRRVNARGGWYLVCLCLAATVWAASEGMLYLGFTPDTDIFISKLRFLGIAPLPPLALLFVLTTFGFESWANKKVVLTLFLITAVSLLVIWTNPLHKLFFTEYYPIKTGPFPMLGVGHGPLWWAVTAYHYFLLAILVIILLHQRVTSSGYQRAQAGVILIAAGIVWLVNAVYVSGHSPVLNMDIGPISFVLVAVAMAWGFHRYGLLDILPVAKAEIFRGLDDIILVTDREDRILDLNPAAESMLKVKASQITGQKASDAFIKFPQLRQIAGKTESSEICLEQDGEGHVYDLRVSLMTDAKGSKIGEVIALRDITDRKKAENALLESERRLREQNSVIMALSKIRLDEIGDLNAALKNITEAVAPTLHVERVGVWLFNEDYSKIECIELYEFNKKLHSAGMELFSENFSDYFRALREERIIAVHDAQTDPRTGEFADSYLKPLGITSLLDSAIRVSGQIIGVVSSEHTGSIRRWALDEQTFAASIADLVSMAMEESERRKAEEDKKKLESQLKRVEKMEAIGMLAGGVAHDLNNIMSGIVSYPELLLMDLPENSPLRKPIQTIKQSGEKASAVVQDLLTLARRGVAITEVVNLNSIVSDYLKSPDLSRLRPSYSGVQVETDLEPVLLNIIGSPVHLFKTIMNLVSNAAEAMPHAGKIRISTENRYIDRPVTGYDHVREGDYVVLSVCDTGIGIKPEDKERIFEPFYTKKVMGRSGTGLGMAVVWGTVKDHKGYIDVKSVEEKGTTFQLFFPVTRKKLAQDKAALSIRDYMGRGEALLVVDDVEEQREIATGMLQRLGYSVSAVSSGEEAVEFVKENEVDLLVLDMIMDAGMDGLDTYREIIKTLPGQKAIIASGFSETERVKEAQRLGAAHYVKKPYTLESIGVAVRNELNR
jgi:PAS domain S-box-containing protein